MAKAKIVERVEFRVDPFKGKDKLGRKTFEITKRVRYAGRKTEDITTLDRYTDEETALKMASHQCRAEHDKLGWPVGDKRIVYPKKAPDHRTK